MRQSDPIVDEVRAARDAIAKESDYDIGKIADAVRVRETRSGRPVVNLPPRKPTPSGKASKQPHNDARTTASS